MSSDWFSVSQRNLATTIAAMSNPIGIAVGQLLPTSLVNTSGGIPTLLLVSAAICTATCLLCFLCVQRAPPTPPSRSTMERGLAKAESVASRTTRTSFWQSPLIGELKILLANKHFLVLMFGVGMGLGLFNAVTTLIEQLVSPSGYDKDDAGTNWSGQRLSQALEAQRRLLTNSCSCLPVSLLQVTSAPCSSVAVWSVRRSSVRSWMRRTRTTAS
jgi:FLVCR family MFS transporter 7